MGNGWVTEAPVTIIGISDSPSGGTIVIGSAPIRPTLGIGNGNNSKLLVNLLATAQGTIDADAERDVTFGSEASITCTTNSLYAHVLGNISSLGSHTTPTDSDSYSYRDFKTASFDSASVQFVQCIYLIAANGDGKGSYSYAKGIVDMSDGGQVVAN